MNRIARTTTSALIAVVSLSGCGGEPSKGTNTVTATSAAAPGDLEKIKEALRRAGIKNDPAAVFDHDEKHWSVTLTLDGAGPNGEPPPGRPIPEVVTVSKVDFTVKRDANPNAPRPGREFDRVVK